MAKKLLPRCRRLTRPPDAPLAPPLKAAGGPPAGAAWSVGGWQLDSAANELRRGAELHHLEPKATEVLACLARRAGEVVSREELLAAVWPGVVVGDDALTQAIIKLRKALGDDARAPAYIETIAKRGYRLIAPVAVPVAAVPAEAVAPAGVEAAPPAPRRRLLALALLLAALATAIGTFLSRHAGTDAPQPRSSPPVVAVLPLANQSGDPQREYFSDGVTEDIIGALGRYSGLRVIARNSVDQFKHHPPDAPTLRKQLGADYVVSGGVRAAEGVLRVSVVLSDTGQGQVLWSEHYEGPDILEIQDRIVRYVVGMLAVKVTRHEEQRARAKPVQALEAYDLVLRARALVVSSDRAANAEARRLLERARQRAPDYAGTYVVLAEAEFRRAMAGWVEDAGAGFDRAEQAARHALTLDDPGYNARAHGQLGLIYVTRRQFDQALAEADQAIALNPSDAFAIDARGDILLWLGRLDEAIATLQTALALDPAGRSSGSGFDLALAYYSLERYPEALATVDATLARYPQTAFLHALRAATLARLERMEAARQAADEVHRLAPFFLAREFGDRFVDPRHTAHLQEGLRKAGL